MKKVKIAPVQEERNGVMKMKEGWYACPKCGNPHMTKIRPDTVLVNFPAYCKKCKSESVINVGSTKPAKSNT